VARATTDQPTLAGGHAPGPYDRSFFADITEWSLPSARIIAPLVQKLIRATSVIDVGCAECAWLKAFQESGATTLKGIDGPWVDQSRLFIDVHDFEVLDFDRSELSIKDRYDLAICLEFAEHVSPRKAPTLIRSLTDAAPVVLFSAAVPGQGGTNHINEQWPAYWSALFAKLGFQRLDPIRRHIWLDRRIGWWYRQNILLFASSSVIQASQELRAEAALTEKQDLELVNRDLLGNLTTLPGLLKALPSAAWRSFRRRLNSGW
jgi:hypothetical protein